MDFDRAYVWAATLDEKGSHLRRVRLATGEFEAPVFTDSFYSLSRSAPLFSERTRELIGVRYFRRNLDTVWFSPRFTDIQKRVNTLLPADQLHRLSDWDDAETRFLVYSHGALQPGAYHVFDASTDTLVRIGSAMPGLEKALLRPTTSVNYTARDGLRLEAYLTVPAGVSRANPAPLVVLPHGGPWVRDTADYSDEVHFLVSRGYAVLRPNYRGSTGYVALERGDHDADFTGMRDDVIDATRAALRSGVFDPRRVAIMGGSFGGYLALACTVEDPISIAARSASPGSLTGRNT